MKTAPSSPRSGRGATMVEAVIAVGVLAVAIPMVFGAIAKSGESGIASQAETRSTWIVPACMREIRASREGCSTYFAATAAGQAFPPAGEVWAIAFAPDGSPVGKLDKSLYEKGTRELDGAPVRFIATLSSVKESTPTGPAPMLMTRISIEYPATAKAAKRRKLDFHTRIP